MGEGVKFNEAGGKGSSRVWMREGKWFTFQNDVYYKSLQLYYNASLNPSSGHVQMCELDHKEGWAPKNWCFQTVVQEKILESPLDWKEIKPVSPKGNQL